VLLISGRNASSKSVAKVGSFFESGKFFDYFFAIDSFFPLPWNDLTAKRANFAP